MLNPQYLCNEALSKVRDAFYANRELPSVTLRRLLDEENYGKLVIAVKKARFRKVRDRHQCHGVASLPAALRNALKDRMLLCYLSEILDRKVKRVQGSLCMFGWKDYTLLHDERTEKAGVDVIIDFTGRWNANAGGAIVYVDGTGEYHHIPSSPNTLSITSRKTGMQKFVQYVNHHANRQRRILFLGRVQ